MDNMSYLKEKIVYNHSYTKNENSANWGELVTSLEITTQTRGFVDMNLVQKW